MCNTFNWQLLTFFQFNLGSKTIFQWRWVSISIVVDLRRSIEGKISPFRMNDLANKCFQNWKSTWSTRRELDADCPFSHNLSRWNDRYCRWWNNGRGWNSNPCPVFIFFHQRLIICGKKITALIINEGSKQYDESWDQGFLATSCYCFSCSCSHRRSRLMIPNPRWNMQRRTDIQGKGKKQRRRWTQRDKKDDNTIVWWRRKEATFLFLTSFSHFFNFVATSSSLSPHTKLNVMLLVSGSPNDHLKNWEKRFEREISLFLFLSFSFKKM